MALTSSLLRQHCSIVVPVCGDDVTRRYGQWHMVDVSPFAARRWPLTWKRSPHGTCPVCPGSPSYIRVVFCEALAMPSPFSPESCHSGTGNAASWPRDAQPSGRGQADAYPALASRHSLVSRPECRPIGRGRAWWRVLLGKWHRCCPCVWKAFHVRPPIH